MYVCYFYSRCTMPTHTKMAWYVFILTIKTGNFLTEVFLKAFTQQVLT